MSTEKSTEKILRLALKNAPSLRHELDMSESSKTSLFGFLQNYVGAARSSETETMESCKKLFGALLMPPDKKKYENNRYFGLKLGDINTMIRILLCDGKGNVLGKGFECIKDDEDLVLYIEYCRRSFLAEYPPETETFSSRSVTPPVSPRKYTTSELPALFLAKDKEVAAEVVNNSNQYEPSEVLFAKGVLKAK